MTDLKRLPFKAASLPFTIAGRFAAKPIELAGRTAGTLYHLLNQGSGQGAQRQERPTHVPKPPGTGANGAGGEDREQRITRRDPERAAEEAIDPPKDSPRARARQTTRPATRTPRRRGAAAEPSSGGGTVGGGTARTRRTTRGDEPTRPKQPRPATKRASSQSGTGTEPTKGEVGQRREQLRKEEADAGGPGPGATVRVVDQPWEGYAGQSVVEILEALKDADDTTKAVVRLYEQANEAREAVLHATEAGRDA